MSNSVSIQRTKDFGSRIKTAMLVSDGKGAKRNDQKAKNRKTTLRPGALARIREREARDRRETSIAERTRQGDTKARKEAEALIPLG